MNEEKFISIRLPRLEELEQKVDQILSYLSEKKTAKSALGEYITEAEAKNILQKGTTWFWNKRKSGELPAKKSGNRWYYKRTDIEAFIENGIDS